MFKFIKETHKYYYKDIEIPSVTSVLPYSFYGNASEYNRDRGSYVHDMIYLYNMNDLNEDNLDPVLAKYVEGYKKFLKENGKLKNILIDIKVAVPQPANVLQLAAYALLIREGVTADGKKAEWTCEEPLFHKTYMFAGTPDIVNVQWSGIKKDVIVPFAMHCLYLYIDGGYKLSPDYSKDYRHNRDIFLSFLATHNWKKNNGLLKNDKFF
jgi:hypothetical protein